MDTLFQDSATGAMTAFYIIYMATLYIILLAFSVVAYILGGKSLSAIARRRGIEKPWLAWVPLGNAWMLGCISDQYRYVAHGQQTNRRGTLLTLNIILTVIAVLMTGLTVAMTGMTIGTASTEIGTASALTLFVLVYIAMILVAVIMTVVQFMAYYDLFRSCDPGKSLVYLLVSIFVSFPLPFFLYSLRNKDLGMPPKSETPQLPCE